MPILHCVGFSNSRQIARNYFHKKSIISFFIIFTLSLRENTVYIVKFLSLFVFMKNLIVILITVLLFSINAFAQDSRTRGNKQKAYGKQLAQLGIGWGYFAIAPEGLSKSINTYNASLLNGRAAFGQVSAMHGPSLAFTSYGNHGDSKARIFFEFGARAGWHKAEATNTLTDKTSTIDTQLYTANLSIGGVAIQRQHFDLIFAFGIDGGALLTNAFGNNSQAVDFNYSQSDIMYGLNVMMPLYFGLGDHASLGIRPYYRYQISNADFGTLNKKLNGLPDSFTSEASYTGSLSNYGIEVHLTLIFNRSSDTSSRRR